MMSADSKAVVVVTGIGGFLGRHVAASLLRQGYDVRGTVRSLRNVGEIETSVRAAVGGEGGDLTFAVADLLADGGWDDAVAGADYVIHVASPFPDRVPADENELIMPARDGALRVLKAAKRAGVRRVVLTSSIAAVNYGSGNDRSGSAPFTETDWTDIDGPLATPYYKSKTIAERAAWDFAKLERIELAVVNPGMILGPVLGGDPGTSVGLIRGMMKGKYPAMPDFRVAIVDARDVADAHVQAMIVPEAAGERFIAAGKAMSFKEIAAVLKVSHPAYARKLPKIVLPNWLARLAALFDPGVKLILKELGRDATVSNEKARRLLGWQPRPEEEAIRASAESLIEAGRV